MKRSILIFIVLCLISLTCCNNINLRKLITNGNSTEITITQKGFFGEYIGVEFNGDGDVAHQFSNKVAKVIGKYLKQSYNKGVYLKIDFNSTKIKTDNIICDGFVDFKIYMSFVRTNKCDAFTGIVHCGTWVNQKNSTLDRRLKNQLVRLRRISVGSTNRGYFETPEGYKEYWVQFKHKDYQKKCR